MKKVLVIVLNSPSQEDRTILSFWWEWKAPKVSRFLLRKRFNLDKWEAAQTHIGIAPGANAKDAWKEAWRFVRMKSRDTLREFSGYVLLDVAAHIDGEPLPLP